jgi:hypothetical protein
LPNASQPKRLSIIPAAGPAVKIPAGAYLKKELAWVGLVWDNAGTQITLLLEAWK